MRSFAITGVANPSPKPLIARSSSGPSVGHFFTSPVSGDFPSRFGPRNCGQSAAEAVFTQMNTHRPTQARYFTLIKEPLPAGAGRTKDFAIKLVVLMP